jgi:hypothetical protein
MPIAATTTRALLGGAGLEENGSSVKEGIIVNSE